MIRILQDSLRGISGKTIVEFGAGYHEPFRFDIAKNNHYIVSDINLRELSILPNSNIDIRCIDACNIKLDNASIDVACSSMLIMHLNIERHFSEVKRILKKDGVYLFAATGLKHNRELKVLGFDPHLDVDTDAMLKYGARLVCEECYFDPFIDTQDGFFWQDIFSLDIDPARLPVRGLTKHYLLFELSPDKK